MISLFTYNLLNIQCFYTHDLCLKRSFWESAEHRSAYTSDVVLTRIDQLKSNSHQYTQWFKFLYLLEISFTARAMSTATSGLLSLVSTYH